MALSDLLSAVLPQGESFEFFHLQNVPSESHPIVTVKQDAEESSPITVKTQHFFVLFHRKKAVYALEVYVYISLRENDSSSHSGERVIFVSKADTTGYCECKMSYRDVTKVLIQFLLSIDPNYYLQKVTPRYRNYDDVDPTLITKNTNTIEALRMLSRRHSEDFIPKSSAANQLYNTYHCSPNITNKISLFTRPAPQYLFSESAKNPRKHLVDGEKLLRWWVSIMDDIVDRNFRRPTKARIRIPGEDPVRVKRYLSDTKYAGWEPGDIFGEQPDDLAVFNIPLFPDDPKSRFLRQLAEENRISKISLRTFWTELQERQEFRLSVTASVIGIQGFLCEAPSYAPSPKDVLTASSKKQFNYIKSYVTGEEYDTVEGACEAYCNIRDYSSIKLGKTMEIVLGQKHQTQPQAKREASTTTLQVRKKPKKTLT